MSGLPEEAQFELTASPQAIN
jgi:hypothetical protein